MRATEIEPFKFSPKIAELCSQIGAVSRWDNSDVSPNCSLTTNVHDNEIAANLHKNARSRELIVCRAVSESTVESNNTQTAIIRISIEAKGNGARAIKVQRPDVASIAG